MSESQKEILQNIKFDCYKRGDGYYFCHGIHLPTGITSKPHDGWSYTIIREAIIKEILEKMAQITFLKDGPALISSDHIVSVDDKGVEKREEGRSVAICRCGKSKNYPYCDGAHTK